MSYLKEIILIILFGIVILTVVKFQIYLSKKEKPFYGLILPIFSFSAVLSGYLLLTPASFETSENFTTDMAVSEVSEDDDMIPEEIPPQISEIREEKMDADMIQTSFIITVMTGNIGTMILLIIYWFQRRKRNLDYELKQMQLDEL